MDWISIYAMSKKKAAMPAWILRIVLNKFSSLHYLSNVLDTYHPFGPGHLPHGMREVNNPLP